MGINIRAKGQRGEREAACLIASWANEVLGHMGLQTIDMNRNLDQTRAGGYDIVGLNWLALEVKRHENLQISQWWKQTMKQTKDGQTPMLMYRQNRTPWRFRLQAPVANAYGSVLLTMDLAEEEAKKWMQWEVWARNKPVD